MRCCLQRTGSPGGFAAWVSGVLAAVAGVLVARPPVSEHGHMPDRAERDRRSAVNPDAAVVVGAPFGYMRPQWILPYGGTVTFGCEQRTIWARYDQP